MKAADLVDSAVRRRIRWQDPGREAGMVGAAVAWADVEALVRRGDRAALLAFLAELDASQRKALVKPVRSAARLDPPTELRWSDLPLLCMVGVAVMPDARSLGTWLRELGWTGDDHGEGHDGRVRAHAATLAQVLLDRDPPWLGNAVAVLADRLTHEPTDPWAYHLIETLRARLDLAPPASPTYVAGWVTQGWRHTSLAARLREDPRFAELVPLILERDGLAGGLLERWRGPSWLDQINEAVELGLVARGAVLGHLLGRLERGGRPAATDQFVKVHDALAPTLDEVAARVGTYVTMLGDPARSTVAGMAQRQLLRLDDAGRLHLQRLEDASQLVLVRKEKKLVRAQLARLREVARRQPADLDALAVAAAAGFANPAGDLQAAVVKLLGEWWPSIGDAARRTVSELAAGLPADLAAQLGADTDAPAAPVAVELPHVEPPRRVVPLDDPVELAAELRRLWIAVRRNRNAQVDGIMLERVVEAVPRIVAADPEAFRSTGRAALEDPTYEAMKRSSEWNRSMDENHGLVALVAACIGDPTDSPRGLPPRLPAPGMVLARRLLDLADACRRDAAVRCVSLPSWSNGVITADDLVERLAVAAARGWEPDGSDLEQALLRLDLDGADPAAFRALGSAAGATAAAWIEDGGLTAPELELATALVDGVDVPMVVVPVGTTPGGAGPLQRLLVPEGPPRMWSTWAGGLRFGAWPLMAPHHPELIAIPVAVEQAIARNRASHEVDTLVALAEAPGPVGAGLHLALAYAMAAKRADRQAAAVDAALVLAARERLDGALLGDLLFALLESDAIVLKRIVGPVAELVHAGGQEQAWQALRALLSRLIAAELVTTGLPDLLTVAAEAAGCVPDPGTVEGLDQLASRPGRSRQVVEAQRLQAVLATRARPD